MARIHGGQRRPQEVQPRRVHGLDRRNRLIAGWCFAPCGSLVVGEVMLAQKIAQETFERGALSVAKRFAPNGGLTTTPDRFLVPWGL